MSFFLEIKCSIFIYYFYLFCPQMFSISALRDGWYQLGSSAFRFFKIKQTRDEAIVTCAANQASLAQFDSELEKQFVHGLVEG